MRIHFTLTVLTMVLLTGVLLTGCSSLSTQDTDGAPDKQVDYDQIPDAEPRIEALSKYGNPDSYVVFGKRYYVRKNIEEFSEQGVASWYGTKFHGQRTSSGEPYDMYAMTAAHKSLPIPSYVKVSNLDNGKSIVVRVNDRGPFVDNRIIDLSYVAAQKLDMTNNGTANVEISVIRPDLNKVAQMKLKSSNPALENHSKNLYVQLGAFSQRNYAENLVIKLQQDVQLAAVLEQLKQRLDPTDVEPSFSVKQSQTNSGNTYNGDLYRVRLGPFRSREITEEMEIVLSQQGYADHFIHAD